MNKIENNEKTHNRIISLIKKMPLSQKEVQDIFNPELTIPAISKHLERGIKTGSLLYLGNKVNTKDAVLLLQHYFKRTIRFGRSVWPSNANQCYIYTPKTEKFYKRLKRRVRDKIIRQELRELYSLFELSAMFQSLMYENPTILKKDFTSRGIKLTDKEIKQKIAQKRKEVKMFYKDRNKTDLTLKFLQFNPLMYWCAFKRPVPVESKEYDATKDLVLIKDALFEKLDSIIKTI